MSHVYLLRFPWLSVHLYLSGFFDHNIGERAGPGLKRDNMSVKTSWDTGSTRTCTLAELRLNEYRQADNTNDGAGLELKTAW